MASCSRNLQVPVVGDEPHQPKSFIFPQREFGKTSIVKRSFQCQWFDRWSWLHYDEDRDCCFCFTCIVAFQNNHLCSVGNLEKSFISTGFLNWKDAIAKFNKHQASRCHQEAVLKTITLPATTRDVGEMLSSQLAKLRLERRKCFLKLLSNARFLSRQGLPLRGDGDETNSNFMQLIYLRSEDDSRLVGWVKQKTDKYTSPEMQNEMVKVMALRILRDISAFLQSSPFYTVMVDETADVGNIEQVVICLRWVSEKFEVHEEFVGLYQVESIEAEKLYGAISDVLLRLNLAVSKVRGQCYDGASAMSGAKSGVAVKLQAVEHRAVFTHCYGHALNLACADTIRQSKLMRDALDTTHEITKLIKKSPRRDAIFKRLKEAMESDTPGIRVLCPTRWTVKAESLNSILENFTVLLSLWGESIDIVRDTEMKARIQGVAAQMKKFDFFFGVSLGLLILRHTDNLSRTLQRADMSAAEGQEVMQSTLSTLQSIRDDSSFGHFWKRITATSEKLDIEKPSLPRRRKTPRRFDEGSAPSFPGDVEEHYRTVYFEALDLIMSCISDRFDQPGYKTYAKVQALLLKAATSKAYQEEFDFVKGFYGSDFDYLQLKTQLGIFAQHFQSSEGVTLTDIFTFFRSCTPGQLDLISQVSKLAKLLLVMPATNATSERSFSALRRIKTYLRATMTQQRLNHLMMLHVHKNCTDQLDLVAVANDFIDGSDHRKHYFGSEFRQSDYKD